MAFDLNLLRVAIAIDEEGSVSRAAQRLGVSQPATSAALARLRKALGDPLFIKTAKGMDGTPRAQALVASAREVLARVNQEILAPAEFDPTATRETFTLALSDIGEMVFLPPILDHFRKHAPNASVCSVTGTAERVEQALESGAIDLAIGYFPDLQKNNFYQQRLFTHHFVCLLRADHPASGERLSLEQFISLGHAVVHSEGRSQELFERHLEKAGIHRRIMLRTPHFMSIPMIVARSDLVATVPHALGIHLGQTRSQVRIVTPQFDTPRFDLRQHWHRKFHHDPKIAWMRGVISELFNDQRDEWRDGDHYLPG